MGGSHPRHPAATSAVADDECVLDMGCDTRCLPFFNATFDVVLSSLAIHNIPTPRAELSTLI